LVLFFGFITADTPQFPFWNRSVSLSLQFFT